MPEIRLNVVPRRTQSESIDIASAHFNSNLFDLCATYIEDAARIPYISSARVATMDPVRPLVLYTHPFANLRDEDTPRQSELDLLATLGASKANIIFSLGQDDVAARTADIARVLSAGAHHTFVLTVNGKSQPTFRNGHISFSIPSSHRQRVALDALSSRFPLVYNVGGYLDCCHSQTYRDLRESFAKTVVPLADVVAKRGWTPGLSALDDATDIGRICGKGNPCYDWTFVGRRSAFELFDGTFKNHYAR